jgi:hypothetical protein
LAKKGTPGYEEWLRHYREKRGKKAEEPASTGRKKKVEEPSLFPESAVETRELLPKGTKRVVYSKSQGKDIDIEVIRFVPSVGKYLCKRADNKYLYYSEEQMKTPVKKVETKEPTYTNSKKDSVSIVPDGTMSAKIERAVAPILMEMTFNGMSIDKEALAKARAEADATLEEHKRQLEELVGHPVNFNNPKETAKLLFDELGLPPKTKKTKDGVVVADRSTAAEALEELAARTGNPVPALITQLRSDQKMIKSYLEKIERAANRGDGALRNQFSASTVSGRLATAFNPTLVEIPDSIKTEKKIYFPADLEEIGMGSICPL